MPNEETDEQNTETSKTGASSGRFAVVMALLGAALIIFSGHGPSMPYIEGHGGNQNPLVGIPNAAMSLVGMGLAFVVFMTGQLMLVISAISTAIWVATNNNKTKNYVALGLVAIVVVILGSSIEFRDTFDKFVSRYDPAYVVPEEPDFETECIFRRSSISQGTYYRGDVHCRGVATEFYADGQKKSEINYGDPRVSRSDTNFGGTCFPKEKKSRRQLFACDVEDGVATYWYPNGQVKSEWLSENGRGTGISTEWYENGHKKRTQEKLQGDPTTTVVTHWYENGQMELRRTMPKGDPYGSKERWCKDGSKAQAGAACLFADE